MTNKKEGIVLYHNDFNKIAFNGFSAIDYDIFMGICTKVYDQGNHEVTFSFAELKKLAGLDSNMSVTEFNDKLRAINKKLLKIDYSYVSGNHELDFNIFSLFDRDKDAETLKVVVSEEGMYLLNHINKNFTAFELQQFVKLDSKYAKTLYRLLKQFKSTGDLKIKIDEFREVLDVPKSYTNSIIMRDIIKPTVEALQPIFPDLRCESIRSRTQGRRVTSYRFVFDAQKAMELDHQQSIFEPPYNVDKKDGKNDVKKISATKPRPKKNSFNNFEQNTYDFDELEKQLLAHDRTEENA